MHFKRASRCLGGMPRLSHRLISSTFRSTNRKTLCVFACLLLCYASIFIVRPLTQLSLKRKVEGIEERKNIDSLTRHLDNEVGLAIAPPNEDLDTQNQIASNLILSNKTHKKLSLFENHHKLTVKSKEIKEGIHKKYPFTALLNDKINPLNHRSYDEDISDDAANEDNDVLAPETEKRKTIFDSYIHYKSSGSINHSRSYLLQEHEIYLKEAFKDPFFTVPAHLLPQQNKGVIILTNYRSGSTFLGELFNQHPDAFYSFEPLLPLHGDCDKNLDLKIDLLLRHIKCDFPSMADMYRKIQKPDLLANVDIHCLQNDFCFRVKTKELCQRHLCYKPTMSCRKCGLVNLANVKNTCRSKQLTVIKVIRFCDIMNLKQILTDQSLDVKVIHLIRDPRGIQSSRSKLHRNWLLENDAKSTCARQLHNGKVGNYRSEETAWLKNRYLRIRYEDLSMDPFRVAKKVYDFAGLKMVPHMEDWISDNTQYTPGKKKKKLSPYSTKRNSIDAMQAWRKHLLIEQVQDIQSVCSEAMEYFGYEPVSDVNQLMNFNITLLR